VINRESQGNAIFFLTMKLFKAIVVAALAFGAVCFPLRAQNSSGPSEAERLKKLEDAVRQLQQRNAELENEVHQLKANRGPMAPILATPEKHVTPDNDNKAVFVAPTPPPVYVQPGGPEYKLTLGGYIQANLESGDVSAFEGRFGVTKLKDRFRLRRARISLTGDFAEQFEFKAEGDFEQNDAAITASRRNGDGTFSTVTNSNRVEFSASDVFINWHKIPEFNIKLGQWKAPFGLENITPDTLIYTIERSLPTGAIVPERQIGVMAWGKPLTNVLPDEKDLVTYYAGMFNGNGRNFNNNDNNEFMYVGRLEIQPWKGKVRDLEASLKISGDYFHSRDDPGTNISPALNLRVNPDGSLSAFTLTSGAERDAFSFDVWLRVGPFDLISEYFEEQVDGRAVGNIAAMPDFNASGFYVLGSYFIVPKKLQAVVKWEHLNPGQFGNDGISSLTGGLNYYIHSDSIKVMANYVHTWSDFREANPDLGDDNFDEILLRMQIIF
jgi:phosphate-selective porin OprO and OprP